MALDASPAVPTRLLELQMNAGVGADLSGGQVAIPVADSGTGADRRSDTCEVLDAQYAR